MAKTMKKNYKSEDTCRNPWAQSPHLVPTPASWLDLEEKLLQGQTQTPDSSQSPQKCGSLVPVSLEK